ncbi:unnamed protein product [Prunus armeniaca]
MVDVQTPKAEEKAEATADVEAAEASENPEGTLAEDEELYGEDEEYGDDEYFKELTEEVIEQLSKERKEEMTKFDNELKVGKAKVKFGDFNEVEVMVVTLPLFFEAQPDGRPKGNQSDSGNPKGRGSSASNHGAKFREEMPEKVCYEMPTKKMASHLKPLYVSAHFDGIPVCKVLVDTGATVNILPALVMKKLKKSLDELIPIETTVSGFVGDTTRSKGIIPLQIRVGGKVRVTAFFVVEATTHFSALLGRDWIHGSMCPFLDPSNSTILA